MFDSAKTTAVIPDWFDPTNWEEDITDEERADDLCPPEREAEVIAYFARRSGTLSACPSEDTMLQGVRIREFFGQYEYLSGPEIAEKLVGDWVRSFEDEFVNNNYEKIMQGMKDAYEEH